MQSLRARTGSPYVWSQFIYTAKRGLRHRFSRSLQVHFPTQSLACHISETIQGLVPEQRPIEAGASPCVIDPLTCLFDERAS